MSKDLAFLTKNLGKTLLAIKGWKVGTPPPNIPRYVAIAAPHTSNLDAYLMLAVGFAVNLKIRWLGKHTIFEPPFGFLFKKLGGIPVIRTHKMGLVEQVAEVIKKNEKIVVFVPPEGTRRRSEFWKSGFYHIARKANVPIVPTALDYKTHTAYFGEPYLLTGNMKVDMDYLRAFYKDVEGRYNEKFTKPRLRDEEKEEEKANN